MITLLSVQNLAPFQIMLLWCFHAFFPVTSSCRAEHKMKGGDKEKSCTKHSWKRTFITLHWQSNKNQYE